MQILDTTKDFFRLVEYTKGNLTLVDLEEYYKQHPEIFREYFEYHCPKTEERLSAAIEKYPAQLEEMVKIAKLLPQIITETVKKFEEHFQLELDLRFNILVGGFGSNAFVERMIIGQIYFCIEKLSAKREHLQVIVAHEIGHVYHNLLFQRENMDWGKVDWVHGLTTLYREGVATYISAQIAPGLTESMYFSYDDEGDEWFDFCKTNHQKIAEAFLQDAVDWTFEKEREWFRLSGGKTFGYNRLGYYLGTKFLEDQAKKIGEREAFILWVQQDEKTEVLEWLSQQTKVSGRV
jgi:hypothetical protein